MVRVIPYIDAWNVAVNSVKRTWRIHACLNREVLEIEVNFHMGGVKLFKAIL
jgi:hypothetical protein